jgi:hypothetical protein
MIENMTVCNLSPAMQRSSIHAVAKFSRYFGRSLDRLEVPLIALGISWTALNRRPLRSRIEVGLARRGRHQGV